MRIVWHVICIGVFVTLCAAPTFSKENRSLGPWRHRTGFSHHRKAALDITTCTAELLDPVSDLTTFELNNVLLVDGHYYVQKRKVSSGAQTHLPDGVIEMLKVKEDWDAHQCAADESRRVVLLDVWQGDYNPYHNMIFYARQFVASVISAWGPNAFTDPEKPLYYGFHFPKNVPDITMNIDHLHRYRSLDVFFSGLYSEISLSENSKCVVLKNVLLTPRVRYYSRTYDTQYGEAREVELHVYSVMRHFYLNRYARNIPNALSSAEDDPIRILYLGRPQHDSRNIINEQELIADMQAKIAAMKGVELTIRSDFESQPFEEQVTAAASNDILIGPHGAGLTHIMFMKPQSVLIELIPEGWADPGYRNLAIFSEKTYMFWQQTNESLSESTVMRNGELVNLGRSNNFAVDVGEVLELLRSAVKIASMVGSRYWPDCPGHEFLMYSRAVPIRCARLWKRDEGIKGDTPPERMVRRYGVLL